MPGGESVFKTSAAKFVCRDRGVEEFLKTKTFEFDKRNVARTYLVYDVEEYMADNFVVLAYFTLAPKPIVFGETISKRLIKEIDGFSKTAVSVGAIIIGQLGKDSRFTSKITGTDIIASIMKLANQVSEIIGGRVVFLECQNSDRLIEFYLRNGFHIMQNNERAGLIQMVRHL